MVKVKGLAAVPCEVLAGDPNLLARYNIEGCKTLKIAVTNGRPLQYN